MHTHTPLKPGFPVDLLCFLELCVLATALHGVLRQVNFLPSQLFALRASPRVCEKQVRRGVYIYIYIILKIVMDGAKDFTYTLSLWLGSMPSKRSGIIGSFYLFRVNLAIIFAYYRTIPSNTQLWKEQDQPSYTAEVPAVEIIQIFKYLFR